MILTGQDLQTSEDYAQFDKLLDKSILVLNDFNKSNPFSKDDHAWSSFEKESFNALRKIQSKNSAEPFSKWNIELIAGGRFPDITAELREKKKFGIEVKTSRGRNWKTLGGSIMESTRIEDVERINILFAKLLPFEIRTKRFEDCVSDVSVTHSPRYLIDLEIDPKESIFSKIGTTYDEVRIQDNPFNSFRDYFREKARKTHSDLWYIDSNSRESMAEDYPSLNINFFSDLDRSQRKMITAKAMILFPEVFRKSTNYKSVSLWLLRMGVLNNSLRDMFSSGGHTDVLGYRVPSKFRRLNEYIPFIKDTVLSILPLPLDVQKKYPDMTTEEIFSQWKTEILQSVIETYIDEENGIEIFDCCNHIFNAI